MSTRNIITTLFLTLALIVVSLPAAAQSEAIAKAVPEVTHKTWSAGAAIPTPVWGAATAVLSGNIYVAGGSTSSSGDSTAAVQVYDPATNSWSSGVSLPTPLMASASAVVKNVLYVFGGSSNINCSPAGSGVWAYSTKTKEWAPKASLPTAFCSADAVVVGNVIYLLGGYDGTNALSAVQSYNTTTNTWTVEASLLSPKNAPAAGLIAKTTIVASGGYINSEGSATGDTEAYDIATNTWTELTSDANPRNAQCFGAVGATLYVAGGSPATNVNESFKLKNDKWTTLTPIPQVTTFSNSVAYKGKLYCISGETSWLGSMLDNVQIYQP
jgi:N-acetylneuraminic acid mutarotase